MKKLLKSLLVLSALFFSAPHTAMADGYPEKAGGKLANGIANAVGGILEIPKTMIITTRTEGPVYGLTVGLMAGILHTLGRTIYGVVDMATFLIPTEPLVEPDYIWHDSDRITSYKAKVEMR
jgi:putative exosortase-associated protein (TIGR04073 family)